MFIDNVAAYGGSIYLIYNSTLILNGSSLFLCNDQGLLMLLANTYLVNLAKIHTGYTYKKTVNTS